ncbi:MAG: DUF438 domain-containing protein [Bryobacterales bacterium]|nr:DUF438 domain-containing protein [Bryobacterales bacterium]
MSELINNRAHRIETLKHIIRHLHAGQAPEAVREQMKRLVGETDYSEIVAMEQELIAEGMPVEEIRSMCDLHSQVTRDVLVQLPPSALPPGHPVDTFRRENQALNAVLGRMRMAFAEIATLAGDANPKGALLTLRQCYNDLMDIDKHYQRKENAVFTKLEAHGITGPSKVMWAKDDEVRALLKQMGEALSVTDATALHWKGVAATLGESVVNAVSEMIYKEENILFPMCLTTFTEEDWGEIWSASPRYGWCLVAPLEGYRPPVAAAMQGMALPVSEAIALPTGTLSLEQLMSIFATLPVDLTFVDADDRVAFFSEGPDRVFARSRAILGRKVHHCHPPKSVHIVDQIVQDFRARRQSVAEFWINFQGRFVHIRYFAVRDAQENYLGTLEVTQDASQIRALSGERRLLEYGPAPREAAEMQAHVSSAGNGHPGEGPAHPGADTKPAGGGHAGLHVLHDRDIEAQSPTPDWVNNNRVHTVIDAAAMLATGEHPLGKVQATLAQMTREESLRIDSSFRPAPLIDMLREKGLRVYWRESEPGRHQTWAAHP